MSSKKYKAGDVTKAYERVMNAIMNSKSMKDKVLIQDMNILLMASEYLDMYLISISKNEEDK